MGRCADLLFKVKKGGSKKLSACVCRMLNKKGLKPMRVTRRERDVLSLLLRGKTNKQIAEALGISGYTARDHVSSLLKKNGVKTRAALMAQYMSKQDSK